MPDPPRRAPPTVREPQPRCVVAYPNLHVQRIVEPKEVTVWVRRRLSSTEGAGIAESRLGGVSSSLDVRSRDRCDQTPVEEPERWQSQASPKSDRTLYRT